MAQPSALRKLLVQSSHYSMAGLLTTAAGFISFPLLTRVFTVADYGAINLVSTTLTLLVSIGKLGLQHAILRYYSDVRSGKIAADQKVMYSTALLGMAATGILGALASLVASQVLPLRWLGDPRLPYLFALISVIVAAQVVESCLINFIRAAQLTSQLAKYSVAKKYVGLGLIVAALLLVARDVRAFYAAMIVTELAFPLALGLYFFRAGTSRPRPSLSAFSPSLLRQMLTYGIPMMLGYEISGIILSIGDRYVIQAKIGGEPLGVYSAAYNLCQYVDTVFVASVGQAIMPIYMRILNESGEAETRKFLEASLRFFVIFAAPVAAGLSAVGPDFLPLVASEKYSPGATVIPFVMVGLVLQESMAILGAGLFIARKTSVIAGLVVGSAALNIGLNLYLVPRMGIRGAAIATLLSYGILAFFTAVLALRRLPLTIPWGAALKAVGAAAVMYVAVYRLHLGGRLPTLALKASTGALLYGVLITLLDERTRDLVTTKTQAILASVRR